MSVCHKADCGAYPLMSIKDPHFESLSDEELMQLYKGGEYAAFETLYGRHSARVQAFLKRKLHDKALVDEVFQDTFMKLHRFRSRYQNGLPFLPWLFTIARNALNDLLRRQAYSLTLFAHTLTEAGSPATPEAAFALSELKLSLSDREWQAMNLRLVENKSFASIALTLETSVDNVRQIISRAGRRFKGLLRGEA